MVGVGSSVLRTLLAPASVEDFAARFWERDWLHVSHPGRAGYEDLLEVEDLDELVAFHRHPAIAPFSLAEHGPIRTQAMTSGVRDAAQALREGQTIFVGSIHERWPAAARLCRALTAELRHPVGATLVVSPPGAQGLEAHFDAADVFCLQLSGHKVWRVARAQRELPLNGDPLATAGGLPEDAVDVALLPGDLLYVPRGFPHLAYTPEGEPSVHLSVYVDAIRWHDVVRRAVDQAAQRSTELRQGVPLGALGGSPDAALAAELRARVEGVLATLDAPGALAEAGEELIRGLPPLPGTELRDALTAAEPAADTVVGRREGALCTVHEDAAGATIVFPGASLTAPAVLGPALRHVAAHERFRVAELPGELTDASRVVLVRRLVRDGLLTVLSRDEQEAGEAASEGAAADHQPVEVSS